MDASSPHWRHLLEDRAQAALEAIARVPGVEGLILAGSLGRGQPWPLSDIDVIPIYADDQFQHCRQAVEALRHDLLDWWVAEGAATSLDVGKLAFTRSEVLNAVALPPAQATDYLHELRWFHSLDKGYGGRAAFDTEGLAERLAAWLSAARFAPDVIQGRIAIHWQQTNERFVQAQEAFDAGDLLAATIGMRESLHCFTRYLIEGWGGRDNSFARFITRLERAATEHNADTLFATIMELYGLTPEAIPRRMALAPAGIRQRHQLSFAARQLVGEAVTAEQDARDVLLVFSTQAIRYRKPPHAAWVGLPTDATTIARQLDHYRNLLDQGRKTKNEGRK